MERKEYNGWTNYETWLAKLWADNSDDAYFRERAQEIFDDAESDKIFTRKERATLDMADWLKDFHEELLEEQMPKQFGLFADLLNAAMSEINWHELAEHYMEDVEEETD